MATDATVWRATANLIAARGFSVSVPERPRSGDLTQEVEFLAPLCDGAVVFGVSGGATLGLELAAHGVGMAGAWLHEPAAGSLAPGLLAHVVEAFDTDGVPGFGSALYGPAWDPTMTSSDRTTVARELAMFRAFEPRGPMIDPATLTLTVGELSPPRRHASVDSLCEAFGFGRRVLLNTSHAAHLDNAFHPIVDELAPHPPTPPTPVE
ncbi:alpha/beta hydrolase [Gordonia sp. CPCC 206044]|uniref:alpha/beta hydrolase n=1 Tax=Gordonia sp. CPCC 206044 TaxID=3140793 RepID=UPI003AF3D142